MKLQFNYVCLLLVIIISITRAAPPFRQPQQSPGEPLAARSNEVVRAQRQADGSEQHDAVDFGAHTGDHGAFGWYADFPVHSH